MNIPNRNPKVLITIQLYDLDKEKLHRIPKRLKKRSKYGKKNASPYVENFSWNNNLQFNNSNVQCIHSIKDKTMDKTYIVCLKIYPNLVTVKVGEYTYEIKENKVQDNKAQRIGSELSRSLKYYEQCLELAQLAWEMQEFDQTDNNYDSMR